MKELDNITEFINSPAFALMSDAVQAETITKQKELALELLKTKIAEHVTPIIKQYNLDVRIMYPVIAYSTPRQVEKPIVSELRKEPKKVVKPTTKRMNIAPWTGLCVYLPDGSVIQESKAYETLCEAIKEAGVERVRALNIMLDKHNIVLPKGNYPYPVRPTHVEGNYYVNTHSSTAAKAQQLEKISDALGLRWKIKIID